MKKLGIILGVLIVLLLAAIVIVPMVIDVDKYRPQVVSLADEHLNGKLELGKLSLSLWGSIRVDIASLKLTDVAGRQVIATNAAHFDVPFLSVLTGSPEANFKMENPQIAIAKDKAGKLNVASLMKQSEAGTKGGASPQMAQPAQTAQTTKPAKAPTETTEIPAIVARSRLGVELVNATVTYKDELTGLSTDLKNLNLVAKDLSLSHPSDIQLSTDLDTKLGKELSVRGPARFSGKISPTVAHGKLDHFQMAAKLDLDDLAISMPGLFEKAKGVPANVDIALNGSEKEMKIEKFDVVFFNADVKTSGTISHLENPDTATVQYQVTSNMIELKSWGTLIPMLKPYELGGTFNFNALIGGQVNKLSYQAKLAMDRVTAKAPELKVEPRFDGTVNITTGQIESMLLTMKAPGNDLTIKGKVVSFSAPVVTMDVTSTSLDLDQMVEWPAKGTKTAAVQPKAPTEGAPPETGKEAAPQAKQKPESDLDAMLDPIRTNAIAQKTAATVNLNMKSIRAQGTKIDDLLGKVTLKDLVLSFDNLSMKLFEGVVKSGFTAQLKPKMPTYHFSAKVSGLDMAEAVKSEMAMFKNTVTGKANIDVLGEGASFNTEPAKDHLKMKGSFKVQDAEFTSIDIGKMVADALSESLSKIGGKIPGIGDKKINNLPSKGSKYDLITSDFGIIDSRLSAPNFVAKASPNKGIDLKGSTQVGIKDMSLKADWDVIDTYNLTHAKDIGASPGGVEVSHILAEGNGPVHFPVTVGCTVMQPCFNYSQVAEYLGKVALANLGMGAKAKLKSQASDQIQKALGNNVSPAIKDKLKGLFGGH